MRVISISCCVTEKTEDCLASTTDFVNWAVTAESAFFDFIDARSDANCQKY
jgi:hypothetical protein